ncbi:MAG: hypothetical protein H6625_02310 [Bdellovibrionaceae bacterium]|nr:hypothetical protein [Pseudobdellovibrionaceae bacterium]
MNNLNRLILVLIALNFFSFYALSTENHQKVPSNQMSGSVTMEQLLELLDEIEPKAVPFKFSFEPRETISDLSTLYAIANQLNEQEVRCIWLSIKYSLFCLFGKKPQSDFDNDYNLMKQRVISPKAKRSSSLVDEVAFRASVFYEGWGQIDEHNSVLENNRIMYSGGYNLKLKSIDSFRETVEERCVQDKFYCLNLREQEFFGFLDTIFDKYEIAKDENPSILLTDFKYVKGVAQHEILHAQFAQMPKYRKAIENYWYNNLTQEERNLVLEKLKDEYPVSGYQKEDPQSRYVIIDEFQAFLLEDPLNWKKLPQNILYHRDHLLEYIYQQTKIIPFGVNYKFESSFVVY